MGLVKRSISTIHLLVGASLVLAACATLPTPEYPSTHPANPAAQAAAAVPTLTSLTSYKAFAGTGEDEAAPNAGQRPAPLVEQSGQGDAHEHQH